MRRCSATHAPQRAASGVNEPVYSELLFITRIVTFCIPSKQRRIYLAEILGDAEADSECLVGGEGLGTWGVSPLEERVWEKQKV